MFSTVVADPAWLFKDKLPGNTRGASSQYDCMPWRDLCNLELPPIADDAVLFLWRVAAMQEQALAVMHMWGFDLKSEAVWIKTKNGVVVEDDTPTDDIGLAFGMGHYVRHCHEVCLIGTRGRAASKVVQNHSTRSVFFAELGEHSEKPEKFYSLVENMCKGPYLELFARKERINWTTLGNELGSTLTVRSA